MKREYRTPKIRELVEAGPPEIRDFHDALEHALLAAKDLPADLFLKLIGSLIQERDDTIAFAVGLLTNDGMVHFDANARSEIHSELRTMFLAQIMGHAARCLSVPMVFETRRADKKQTKN